MVMDADGRGLQRLTRNRADDLFPSWAPDGTQLVFQSARTGDPEIHTMNADGTDVRRVTDSAAPNFEPSWSPARRPHRVHAPPHEPGVFSIAPDGSGELRLTADSGEDFDPSWSPDGASIVWTSDRGGTYDLYTMDADGTGVQQVTDNAALDEYPDWRRTCGVTGAAPTNCGAVVANTIVGGGGNDIVWAGAATTWCPAASATTS